MLLQLSSAVRQHSGPLLKLNATEKKNNGSITSNGNEMWEQRVHCSFCKMQIMRPDISPSVLTVVKIRKTLAFAKGKKSDSVPGRQIEYYTRSDQNCLVAVISHFIW